MDQVALDGSSHCFAPFVCILLVLPHNFVFVFSYAWWGWLGGARPLFAPSVPPPLTSCLHPPRSLH